jgi:hypothetical protein
MKWRRGVIEGAGRREREKSSERESNITRDSIASQHITGREGGRGGEGGKVRGERAMSTWRRKKEW